MSRESLEAPQLAPGVYGKLPVKGDFITRRLPASFVDPWDNWLQDGIGKAKARWPAEWLQAYLTSPVWRFVTGAGVLSDSPWGGLLMPSVDSVGRYFPLTVALPLPLDVNPIGFAGRYGKWFDAIEDVLLFALDDQLTNIEDWDAQLVANRLCFADIAIKHQRSQIGFGEQWQIPLNSDSFADCLPDLLDPLLRSRLGAYSLWWSKASENCQANVLLSAGMPSAHQFCGLLNGDWQTSGWSTWLQAPMLESL